MIIDLIEVNGNMVARYESEIIPRIGETISTFTFPQKPEKRSWVVQSVDHLIKTSPKSGAYLELVSVVISA